MVNHSVIKSKFKISIRRSSTDNFPISAKHGGRNMLGEVFRALSLNKGAEIGVKRGAYSKILCLANPDIELTCVDQWRGNNTPHNLQPKQDKNFRRAVKALSKFNVKFLRKTSMDALADFEDESLDFVYIDANHEFDYVCPDIIFWSQKVRSGGIIACHDYFNHLRGGVVKAVDAYVNCHNITPWYVTLELYPTAFWVKP